MSLPLEKSDPADAANDAAYEAYVLRGEGADDAEAGEEDAAPEAAQPREFKYRGKTVKVDPDTYELLETLKNEARGANGRLGSEIARLREHQAKLEGMVTARTPEPTNDPTVQPPDPLLATRDIAAYQRDLLAYHAAREVQLQERLERKYLATIHEAKAINDRAAKEKAWADDFYSQYDHLDHREIKPVVAQVWAEHESELATLNETDPAAAQERLAELADARLLRVTETASGRGKTATKTNRPPRVESSAGPTPRGSRADAPAREFSAATWVAQQRQKMNGRAVKG